jgi:hypothetical protein
MADNVAFGSMFGVRDWHVGDVAKVEIIKATVDFGTIEKICVEFAARDDLRCRDHARTVAVWNV